VAAGRVRRCCCTYAVNPRTNIATDAPQSSTGSSQSLALRTYFGFDAVGDLSEQVHESGEFKYVRSVRVEDTPDSAHRLLAAV